MNRRVLRLIIGSLLLPLGCGGNDEPVGLDEPTGLDEPLVLQLTELCSDNPVTAIATFENANLEAAVRTELGVGAQDDLTCGLVSGLTELAAEQAGLTSLVGIQNLTSLTFLDLNFNSITDISALSGLTSLTLLGLGLNSITDISALSGLTSLTFLRLSDNSISDISALSGLTSLMFLDLSSNPNLTDIPPLLDNAGLGANDFVKLDGTNVSCADVAALQAKGVTVESDCP